ASTPTARASNPRSRRYAASATLAKPSPSERNAFVATRRRPSLVTPASGCIRGLRPRAENAAGRHLAAPLVLHLVRGLRRCLLLRLHHRRGVRYPRSEMIRHDLLQVLD